MGEAAGSSLKVAVGTCPPVHVAIIMDGNGRWARARGLPRFRGHAAGMRAVREAVEGAIEAGVQVLTLYAFSQENWNRPAAEVAALMRLLQRYLVKEREELQEQGVRVRIFGQTDRLPPGPARAVEEIQRLTEHCDTLQLNLMISYGSRAEIVRAAQRIAARVRDGELAPHEVTEADVERELYTTGLPDPDLLIRTSGEQRISNFMLWQLAYTELYMTNVLWPDFSRTILFDAIHDYQKRERRFGRVNVV